MTAPNVKPAFALTLSATAIMRAETAIDVVARERLLDAAMGADRRGKTSERLREGNRPQSPSLRKPPMARSPAACGSGRWSQARLAKASCSAPRG